MKRSIALILAAGGLLSACAGASTRFYTLEPSAPAPGAAGAYAGPPFRIDAVHIPASLDRPELVRDSGGGRFTVSDNDHWAAPVGELLRRVLTQDLAAQLPPGAVIYPETPKPTGASALVVDILSVSSAGGGVTLEASWTLISVPGPNGQPAMPARPHAVRLTTASVGAGVSGNAAELSTLAGQLSSAIAKDLATAP